MNKTHSFFSFVSGNKETRGGKERKSHKVRLPAILVSECSKRKKASAMTIHMCDLLLLGFVCT